MATILRSSKYIRYLNVFTRRTVVYRVNGNYTSKFVAPQIACISSYLTKSYATIEAVQRYENVNFEKHIAKLDENVQRYGRVYQADVEDILSKIRASGFISSLDGLLLIRCCGELMVDAIPAVKTQLVQEIWNTLEALKIPMDVFHFNALLRVYLENNYDFSTIEFLTQMKDKGVEPNRITYQRLILHNCKKGNIEGATGILEFMREKSIPLNEGVFSALITGHSEANDMESAKNILNVMKNAGVEPSSSTYAALLKAYAKRGDMESIKNVITECEAKQLYLHDADYFDVIHGFAEKNYNESIDEILLLMSRSSNYNHDAFHAILKILDVGNLDAALKILSTMKKRKNVDEDSDENGKGSFLIKKLIIAKFPSEKVIQACEYLEKKGMNTKAFSLAVEQSLSYGYVDLSVSLIKAWNKHGGSIREHFFWPILVTHGKDMNYQGIEDVLKIMTTDLKVIPGVETISDYILPYTLGRFDDVIGTLKEFQIPHNTIMTSMAIRMLMDKKIRKAAIFMMSHPSDYEGDAFYRHLADALKYTEDVRSFVAIVRILHESAINCLSSETSDGKSSEESKHLCTENVVDLALRKVLFLITHRRQGVVNGILDQLIQGGMSLSPESGNHLRRYFDTELTPEIGEKIENLTSGRLTLVPLSEYTIITPGDESTESGGEQEVSILTHSNYSLMRYHLSSAISAKNANKVQSLAEELDAHNFTFSLALYAQMIDVFCATENMEQAEKWMTKCKEQYTAVVLDFQKSTDYAALLIKNGRFDDALKFILESPRESSLTHYPQRLKKHARGLLDMAAESGNVEFTEKLLEALVKAKYAVFDNFSLGPLVRVHLLKNDLKGALNAFEKACNNHKCTPLKQELSKKFIDAEDANSLQLITDLSTQIHGETNSLIDLVLAFVECGRLRQARKILETPGLRLRSGKLMSTAIRYIDEDKFEYLAQFIELTKGLLIHDRQDLYDVLMDVYSKKNKWQCGLNLWMEMQDENIQPSETFLKTLAELLKENNQPIPFIHSKAQMPKSADRPSSNQRMGYFLTDFYEAIEKGDLDGAEKIMGTVSPKHTEFSTIVSTLVKAILEQRQDVDKATELIKMLMTQHKRLPRPRAFRVVMQALVDAEKYDEIRNFDKILNTATKKQFRFGSYLNQMAIRQFGVVKFLNDFEVQTRDSKEDTYTLTKYHLSFTALFNEVVKDPSVLEKFMEIAKILAERKIHLPMNVLWAYYMKENKPEADEIWSKYLANANWIIFGQLLTDSKERNDIDLIERVHDKISNNMLLKNTEKSIVTSTLIELYITNERYEDALKVLKNQSAKAAEHIKSRIPNSIIGLKKGLEDIGQSLPSNLNVNKS